MSKRSLDYNLSLPTSKKSKTKHEEHESDEEEMVENPMMDLFSMNDSVTARDNHIYFYCSVNKKNILKLITAIRDVTKRQSLQCSRKLVYNIVSNGLSLCN